MAFEVFRDPNASVAAILGMRVAIIGYGNQGRAHALNLRDSGVNVVIGQRPGSGSDRAAADGWSPRPASEAVQGTGLVILTLPDESAAETYEWEIAPVIEHGATLGFVHGFNIRFGFIRPAASLDVVMIAPKGPGSLLRSLFVDQKGLPALLAVHQDASGRARETARAWAAAIGSTRAGVVETTFASETETDLFGEQAVLCGGVTALMKAAFETLVESGYQPEFAYLECIHELKQIVDLIYERGVTAMRERISNTAEYGDLTRGPRIIGMAARAEMRRVLEEIKSGEFANEWINEYRSGGRRFKQLHIADSGSLLENAGRTVRALMPWLAKPDHAGSIRHELGQ
jgi:ketol-acid reductoisomerase